MKVPSIENFTTEIKITPGIRYATLNLSGHETVYLLFDSAFLYKDLFVQIKRIRENNLKIIYKPIFHALNVLRGC